MGHHVTEDGHCAFHLASLDGDCDDFTWLGIRAAALDLVTKCIQSPGARKTGGYVAGLGTCITFRIHIE